MLVFYRRAHGWERTGAMLPTEEFLSICWDTQKPYGAFSWPVALEIVTAEIAAHGDEHYRCEIGPASATEIRKLHTQKEATQMATKKAKKGVSKEYLAKHLERADSSALSTAFTGPTTNVLHLTPDTPHLILFRLTLTHLDPP